MDLAAYLGDRASLIAIALFAATVNGAIGYGFSTLVVPVGLLLYPNRTLTPAIVLAEIGLNFLSLVANRKAIPRVMGRILRMTLGAIPGIVLGSVLLKVASSEALRLGTFVVLLPLVLLQVVGVLRPVRSRRAMGAPAGFGIGVLYACTSISGPPLGMLLNGQGFTKDEFRSAISVFRIMESVVTGIAYWYLSIYTSESVRLSGYVLPCVIVGVPLGRVLVHRLQPERFRRVTMTLDAWLIGFGLSRLLGARGVLESPFSYLPMALVAMLTAYAWRASLAGGLHAIARRTCMSRGAGRRRAPSAPDRNPS